MYLRTLPTVVCAAVLMAGAVASALGPASWVQSSYDDFKLGRLDSVALASGGDLRLSPELELVEDTDSPYVWALAGAADGTVYYAAGDEGEVYRFRAGSPEPERLLASVGAAVHAMELGPDDHLYVSVSPSGAISRLPLGDEEGDNPWYEPRQRYAWAMTFDSRGRLYLGTGGEGLIFRVDGDGSGELFYDSSETHVTALAVDRDDNVYAGTDGSGHVYRISRDGQVKVLFDSPLRQITGLAITGRGVFAAGIGPGSEGAKGAADSASLQEGAITASGGPSTRTENPSEVAGAVFLIHPDGFVEQLWSSDTDSVHAMVPYGRGVIVGTGPQGRLLSVETGEAATILQKADAAQVTVLRSVGDGELLVGTSNLGKVYRLRRRFHPSGEYVSQVKDTQTTSSWGRIRWRGTTPAATSIRLFTRAGNTETPDDTWTDWTGPLTDATGSEITSPSARFIQWKAELATSDPSQTPVLEWVELVYVQRNLPPNISGFTVHPSGVVYRQAGSFEETLPFGQLPPALEAEVARQQGREPVAASAAMPGRAFLGRPFFVPGSQTFSWQSTDPNGDRLTYTVAYRGEGESAWKPIVSEVEETTYTWDTTAVPDGLYRVRLTASDAPSNPEGLALDAMRTSEPFVIDNTPPEFRELEATLTGPQARLTGRVSDTVSLIRQIEYAVDGGAWRTVLPADGLADSETEGVDFQSVALTPGEHTIVVRATDAALNRGSGKVIVVVR